MRTHRVPVPCLVRTFSARPFGRRRLGWGIPRPGLGDRGFPRPFARLHDGVLEAVQSHPDGLAEAEDAPSGTSGSSVPRNTNRSKPDSMKLIRGA